jgi:hypothetical protein
MELILGMLKKLWKNREIRHHFGVGHSIYQAYDVSQARIYE